MQRTFATVRSVELDAVLLAGCRAAGADALPARTPRPAATAAALDPRVVLLVEECYRHGKAIGAWGAGPRRSSAARHDGAPGVVLVDDAARRVAEVQQLMAAHRVWDRFAARLWPSTADATVSPQRDRWRRPAAASAVGRCRPGLGAADRLVVAVQLARGSPG